MPSHPAFCVVLRNLFCIELERHMSHGRDAAREPKPEDNVIEPALQQADQVLHPVGSVQAHSAYKTPQMLLA